MSLGYNSYRAKGSMAATPYDISRDLFQWEDKHLSWARSYGALIASDETALTSFLVHHAFAKGPHDDRRTEPRPCAPKWLHAFWDVCSETVWVDRAEKRSLTTKGEDIAVGKRLLADRAFRLAFEVIYDEGGIPALAELFAKVYNGEM